MKFGARLFIALTAFAINSNAANIVIVNGDGPGEGFNDRTRVAPVGGNTGTTLGEQRINVFQRAADLWGALLQSDVDILVEARFNALSCDANGGVLGAAGPIAVFRNFSNAPFSNTWYHAALADRLAGFDLTPGQSDITATFNSSIDNNDACLQGRNWYYGLDGNSGLDVELLPVVLHELGHGLGFSTLVDLTDGTELFGAPDAYERFIRDNTLDLTWNEMTSLQRQSSATNTGHVVWDGRNTQIAAARFLSRAPIMQVNSPPSLPATIQVGTASFGPVLTDGGITGNVVLVDDMVGVSTDGCQPLVNVGEVNGNIALIDRGSCTFVSKALVAQAAGAVAVIIADNVADDSPIGLGGSDPSVTIPTVSITLDDGNAIKGALASGVNVTLTLDADQLSGTDSQRRVKLYAPSTLQLGSSISHWDVSTTPNLLMEPSLTTELFDGVDLTLYHFEDLGWLDVATSTASVPSSTRLYPNVPNPFNPSTRIAFSLANTGNVQLDIHDVSGRIVRRLLRGAFPRGDHSVDWDGRDEAGADVASGVYFYRFVADGFESTRRMVLMR